MNENIFKNAYFGKPYKTRNERKALLLEVNNCANLAIDCGSHTITHDYKLDGTSLFGVDILDIVSEWQEEVNEEKLDELARIEGAKAINHFVNREQSKFAFGWADLVSDAFKTGYYKASEHFLSVETIRKICDLITDWTEQIMLGENITPLAEEYLTKRDELLGIENYGERTEKMAELYNEYEARYVSENLSYE